MAVTITEKRRLDNRSVLVRYESDLPEPVTYYRYLDGTLVDATSATSWVISGSPGEIFQVEIFDDPDDRPALPYPARLVLSWDAIDDADHYLVQESVSGQWVTRRRYDDHGEGHFKHVTRVLEDDTTHQFRVLAVGTNGNAGTAREVEALMVRSPDEPQVTYTYNGSATPTLTIS